MFQEFIPIEEWRAGKRESDRIDVSKIDKIPIELFSHENDEVCLETLTLEQQISGTVKLHTWTGSSPYGNHIYATAGNYDDDFLDKFK